MSDQYDSEIERLRVANDPFETFRSWNDYTPLFKRVGEPNNYGTAGRGCGCLTQVRHKNYAYGSQFFEDEIKNDARIPVEPLDPDLECNSEEEVQARHEAILANLEVFAEWQRRIDNAI